MARHLAKARRKEKSTGKELHTRAQQQGQNEQEEVTGMDTQGEQYTSTPNGAKRRRINRDGDSVSSPAVSREVDEETGRSSQPDDVRIPQFKTLPRDTDGYVLTQSRVITSDWQQLHSWVHCPCSARELPHL